MFMRFIAPAVLLATSLCGVQETAAQDIDEAGVDPPIIIDSDTNQYDLRTGVTRFSDNVTIQRGAMRVKADEGVVHQADGRITLVELFGKPTTWRDQLDDGSIVEGQAEHIQFEVIENVITLIGDARLQHEQGQFTGDQLVYDLDTESLAGRGSDGNQARVILEGETIRRESTDATPQSESATEDDSMAAAPSASEDGDSDEADSASSFDAGPDADLNAESAPDSDADSDPDADNGGQDRAAPSDPDRADVKPVEPPVDA